MIVKNGSQMAVLVGSPSVQDGQRPERRLLAGSGVAQQRCLLFATPARAIGDDLAL